MITQRVGLAALRRGARPNAIFFNQNTARLALSTTPTRPVATTNLSNEEGHQILVNQRLNRPVSPHLGIYKLEQSWFSYSAWTRITGVTLSGATYLYFSTYLVAPLFGWHVESAALASTFATMPFLLKGGVKFFLGFPFAYHFFSGCRHLTFDLGKGFAKKSFARAETVLWSSAILGGLYLAFGI